MFMIYNLHFPSILMFFDAVTWYLDTVACSVGVSECGLFRGIISLYYRISLSKIGFLVIVWLSFSCWSFLLKS
jgi:hypothetical protein